MQSTPYPAHSVVRIDWEGATCASGLPVRRPEGVGDLGVVTEERDEDGDYRVTVLAEQGEDFRGLWVHEDALTPAIKERQDAPRVRVVVASDATDGEGGPCGGLHQESGAHAGPAPGPWHGVILEGPDEDGDYAVKLDRTAETVWVAPSGLTIETEPPRRVPSVGDIVRVTGDGGESRHGFKPDTVGMVGSEALGSGYVTVFAVLGQGTGVCARRIGLEDLEPVNVTDKA